MSKHYPENLEFDEASKSQVRWVFVSNMLRIFGVKQQAPSNKLRKW